MGFPLFAWQGDSTTGTKRAIRVALPVSLVSHHLVILHKIYLDRILRGRKTLECRLSRTRRPPFGAVSPGDTLWLKQSGGPVVATATVRRVTFIHPLQEADLANLRTRYADALQAHASFYTERQDARFATLIRLSRVRRIPPFDVQKSNRNGWVVLAGPLA